MQAALNIRKICTAHRGSHAQDLRSRYCGGNGPGGGGRAPERRPDEQIRREDAGGDGGAIGQCGEDEDKGGVDGQGADAEGGGVGDLDVGGDDLVVVTEEQHREVVVVRVRAAKVLDVERAVKPLCTPRPRHLPKQVVSGRFLGVPAG